MKGILQKKSDLVAALRWTDLGSLLNSLSKVAVVESSSMIARRSTLVATFSW
jgi:hypothetical protein